MTATDDKYECLDCDHVFTRSDSEEYQIIHNRMLDDDIPDSDTVCSSCGSNNVEDYEAPTISQHLTREMTPGEVYFHAALGVVIIILCLTVILGIDYPTANPTANPQAPIAKSEVAK